MIGWYLEKESYSESALRNDHQKSGIQALYTISQPRQS